MSKLPSSGAFGMRAGDRVRHDITGRTGVAHEFLQDGDASVTWDDGTPDTVKWNNLSPCPQSQTTATPVTPIMVEAPTVACLRDNGYETCIITREPEDVGIHGDTSGDEQIAAWEPARPSGDGWMLHFKGWTEDASIMAVWAREL